MTLRRFVGPPVALGGIALFVGLLFDYFFDASEKITFFDLIRGAGIAATLIIVGIAWAKNKVYGSSKADEDARKNVGSDNDLST